MLNIVRYVVMHDNAKAENGTGEGETDADSNFLHRYCNIFFNNMPANSGSCYGQARGNTAVHEMSKNTFMPSHHPRMPGPSPRGPSMKFSFVLD